MDRSATIRRYRRIDANRMSYSATGTAYPVGIQDMKPEMTALYQGEIGKTFDIYCDDTAADIQDGDEMVIAAKTYTIGGKQLIDFGGVPFIHFVGTRRDTD